MSKSIEETIELNEKQATCYDFLITSFSVRVVRTLYRSFQSDAEWEWPFDKKIVYKFSSVFKVKEEKALQGIFNFMMFLNVPLLKYKNKLELDKKWHKKDWYSAAVYDGDMFKSMYLTMLLQKR